MKILSLRLKNLNSLKGEWKIDFTQAPFANNSLFAITGPTGAGKSTPAGCHLPGAVPRDPSPEKHLRLGQRHHDAPHGGLPSRGGV